MKTRMWFLFAVYFVGLASFGVYSSMRATDTEQAGQVDRASELAAVQSERISAFIVESREFLTKLSERKVIRNLTADQCWSLPLDMPDTTLNIVDRQGRIVCSSDPDLRPPLVGATTAVYAGRDWLSDTPDFSLPHGPTTSPGKTPPVEMVAVAGDNRLVMPLDERNTRSVLTLPDLGDGQQIAMVDRHGHLVAAHPIVPGAEDATIAETFVAGVKAQRIVASAPVKGTQAKVYVSFDWDLATAENSAIVRSAQLALLAALLVGTIVFWLAHRNILRPIRDLNATMRRALTDPDERAEQGNLVELDNLAVEFNTLLAAREEVRRQLAAALAKTATLREEEKQTLAMTLHDTSIQSLVAARWFLESMADDFTGDPEDLNRLRRSLDAGIDELREHAVDLMPRNLPIAGLHATLKELLESLREDYGVAVDLDYQVRGKVPPEAKALVFRTLSEALRNVALHAGATRAHVAISRRNGSVYALVTDDGRGFDPTDRGMHDAHLGIITMRETITMEGGTFDLSSAPGSGTTVEFSLPVPARPEDDDFEPAEEPQPADPGSTVPAEGAVVPPVAHDQLDPAQ